MGDVAQNVLTGGVVASAKEPMKKAKKKGVTHKEGVGNLLTGGAVQLGTGSQAITRELGVRSGVHTPTSEKKDAANQKIASDKEKVVAENKAAKEKDEDIRRRTAIFQSIGGQVAVGGRKSIYGN